MKLLLDTHALYWWLMGSAKLSPNAGAAIADQSNSVHVSVVTAFELGFKVRLGKLPEASPLASTFEAAVLGQGFELLLLTTQHALVAANHAMAHRDPFDRMLIAQAEVESMALVTADAALRAVSATSLW